MPLLCAVLKQAMEDSKRTAQEEAAKRSEDAVRVLFTIIPLAYKQAHPQCTKTFC